MDCFLYEILEPVYTANSPCSLHHTAESCTLVNLQLRCTTNGQRTNQLPEQSPEPAGPETHFKSLRVWCLESAQQLDAFSPPHPSASLGGYWHLSSALYHNS